MIRHKTLFLFCGVVCLGLSACASPDGTSVLTGAASTAHAVAGPASSPGVAPPGAPRAAIAVAPSRLPDASAESWTAQAPGPVRAVTGHTVELNECAGVAGASTWQQQPYLSRSGNPAILEIYTFDSAARARAAFDAAGSGMGSCQAASRALQRANHITPDAVCRQTASAAGAVAFERTWTGVEGMSAAGPQINHLYLAVRGPTLLALHFDELPASGGAARRYDVHADPSVLTMLTGLLAHEPAGS
jgi:hypothetical protein